MNIRKIEFLFPLLFALLFSSLPAQANVDERSLIKMALESGPRVQSIEATLEAAKIEEASTSVKYDPRASAQYTYAESDEQAIIQFIPVYKPEKSLQLGLEQKLPFGVHIKTGLFANQISTADRTIDNATQVGGQVNLEIDIWKNFLGRLDASEVQSKKLSRQIAEVQSQISKQELVTDIRKIYWALVTNEHSLDLSSRLVKTSKQQLSESLRRSKEGVSDRGDVARNRAQVESRESAALFFSYQKEVLSSQLHSLLPNLKSQALSVNKDVLPQTEKKALQCIQQIAAQEGIDTGLSDYSTLISLIDKQKPLEMKLAKASNKIDVKLLGRYQTSGVDNSHKQAFDNLRDEYKDGYQVGIAVSIPLGKSIDKIEKSRSLATQKRLAAQSQSFKLKLKAEHQKAKRSLRILDLAAKSQAKALDSLSVSYKQSKRKYKQARISLNTYVLEQDNLFNSELQLIDTKRQIINLLLDYFKVFPKHPCSINSFRGAQL